MQQKLNNTQWDPAPHYRKQKSPPCPCLSLSVPSCPILSLSVPVCPFLSHLVPVCPCLSRSVPVCPCLSVSLSVCPCMSLSVLVSPCPFLCVNFRPCLSLCFQVCRRFSGLFPFLSLALSCIIVSCVTSHVLHVKCHVLCVTCHQPRVSNTKSHNPFHANSPIIHKRQVQNKNKNNPWKVERNTKKHQKEEKTFKPIQVKKFSMYEKWEKNCPELGPCSCCVLPMVPISYFLLLAFLFLQHIYYWSMVPLDVADLLLAIPSNRNRLCSLQNASNWSRIKFVLVPFWLLYPPGIISLSFSSSSQHGQNHIGCS